MAGVGGWTQWAHPTQARHPHVHFSKCFQMSLPMCQTNVEEAQQDTDTGAGEADRESDAHSTSAPGFWAQSEQSLCLPFEVPTWSCHPSLLLLLPHPACSLQPLTDPSGRALARPSTVPHGCLTPHTALPGPSHNSESLAMPVAIRLCYLSCSVTVPWALSPGAPGLSSQGSVPGDPASVPDQAPGPGFQ